MHAKEVDRYLEWVVANVPLLAMRDSDALKKIIRSAIEDTQGIRIMLSVVGVLIGGGVGAGLVEFLPEAANSRLTYVIVVSVAASLFGYLFSIAGEVLVHRKIRAHAESSH